MRIASVHIRNFKRFTDLEIRDIPQTAKLVVVVGPNGCGKSSLFDAFLQWYRGKVGFGFDGDMLYYRKHSQDAFQWNESVTISLHDSASPRKGSLYIRTAYRNDPDFAINSVNRPDDPSQNIRIERAIQNDQAVSGNYRQLIYDTMSAVYNEQNDSKTVRLLREELIGHIRESMKRVFGDLLLNNIADPLSDGTFFFEKGAVKSYHFKNLSGGEKAAFDLLLDLHVKKKFFANAVYCIGRNRPPAQVLAAGFSGSVRSDSRRHGISA
jgi:energy-coupling factor transporter ATP-binding protein EcfA2